MRRITLLAMPTVGAGSSQSEDSPAQRPSMRIPDSPHASHLWGPMAFITMRLAALVRAGTRYARHRPYQERGGKPRHNPTI